MTKKIGVIGSGVVGVTLANGFLEHGYDVTIGSNDSNKRTECCGSSRRSTNRSWNGFRNWFPTHTL